jgi:hypothetical protein
VRCEEGIDIGWAFVHGGGDVRWNVEARGGVEIVGTAALVGREMWCNSKHLERCKGGRHNSKSQVELYY